jgi:hypothetical protein
LGSPSVWSITRTKMRYIFHHTVHSSTKQDLIFLKRKKYINSPYLYTQNWSFPFSSYKLTLYMVRTIKSSVSRFNRFCLNL